MIFKKFYGGPKLDFGPPPRIRSPNRSLRVLAEQSFHTYRHPLEVLARHPQTPHAIVDYAELVAEPAKAVEHVYVRLGLEMSAEYEAVLAAGHLRLRPILMTTLTTILGLVPMALSWGEGAELRTPLAITVISGLLFSTFITLVVIPSAYMLVPSRVEAETGPGQEGESP